MTSSENGAEPSASEPNSEPTATAAFRCAEERAVSAMLELAVEKGWSALRLLDVAKRAGISLADLSEIARSKTDLLVAWARQLDRQVMDELAGEDLSGEKSHDRLFDVLMLRFDMMARHKEAVLAIHEDAGRDPFVLAAMAKPARRSMSLMLEAAGIDSSGPAGFLRVQAVCAVMAAAFRVWLWDGPDQAKTMAELDRRLRRAEGFGRRASRLFKGRSFGRRCQRRSKRDEPYKGEEAAQI